jgi:glucose-6-phosphate-specific signal transduction histidine kinase
MTTEVDLRKHLQAAQPRLYGASILDFVGSLLLTGFGIASLAANHVAAALALTVGLATMPVAWRRRAPLGCALAFVVGVGVSALATDRGIRCGAVYPAGMLLAYSIGLRGARPKAALGLGIVLAGQLLESVTDAKVDISAFPFVGLVTAGIWTAAQVVRGRNDIASVLIQRADQLDQQREENARLAVDVEKLRIAADLDIVARSRLAKIVDIADAGQHDTAAEPGVAHARFAEIEHSGRETLNEMRGLLGVLRSDEPQTLAPPPTLAQIDELLTLARAGGRVVEFGVAGDVRPLPAEIEASGYRILQHLLTTVIAADDRGPITVHLRYTEDAVMLEVIADAGEERHAALLAARERASVHAGSLIVDRLDSGRRRLRAWLPVAVARA